MTSSDVFSLLFYSFCMVNGIPGFRGELVRRVVPVFGKGLVRKKLIKQRHLFLMAFKHLLLQYPIPQS